MWYFFFLGPLNVDDVTKDSCHLSWKAPDDDGGQDIQYVVEKQDQATGVWEPVAECKGTNCDVGKLTPNHEYKFRVKAVNRQGESAPLVTQMPIVAKNPFDEPGKTSKKHSAYGESYKTVEKSRLLDCTVSLHVNQFITKMPRSIHTSSQK